MEIKRDSYLGQLISYRFDGLVKVITGKVRKILSLKKYIQRLLNPEWCKRGADYYD